MFGRRTRLTHAQAAEVLDDLDAPITRAGRDIHRAALMLAPSIETTQSATHREKVLDVMLREFRRADRGDLPVLPQVEADEVLPENAPVLMRVDGVTARMLDLDAIDDEKATAAAHQIAGVLAARSRRDR